MNVGRRLHVISFNIPWPANYGGVMDVYYKVEALSRLGFSIILHCYEYEHTARPTEELLRVCDRVYYYPRERGLAANLHYLPYNVYGRRGEQLIRRLLEDDAPILFDGLQSCFFLDDERLRSRYKIVRPANVEHHYYRAIARAERGFVGKSFHYIEAFKFALFERKLEFADLIIPVSSADVAHYARRFPHKEVLCVPCFHPYSSVQTQPGSGGYILYHAKLSVPENEVAALWLVEHIFSQIDIPVIVAGMNPSERLARALLGKNIRLVANPDERTMQELITEAHIHLLWTNQPTGLKLKLLSSLFAGRHVVVNDLMLVGTGLDALCHIASSPSEAMEQCKALMDIPVTSALIDARQRLLYPTYDTLAQAMRIAAYLP